MHPKGWTEVAAVKRNVQSAVRRLHVIAARDLPARVSIYLHDLPEAQWDAFRGFVGHFRSLGYTFVDPNGLCAPGDDRRIMVSFDDCFRNWVHALPLFADLDIAVTFYVNSEPIRDRADASTINAYFARIDKDPTTTPPLSTDEIRELAAAGHRIGAHGHTHHSLNALAPETARDDIRRSRDILEEIVGSPIVDFSYPYGMRRNFNEDLRAYCLSIGFTTVANAIPGMMHAGQRPEALQRAGWHLDEPIEHNIDNLRIDGRWFEKLTGRSAAPF
jgi:peptidoglycan/xylan/chitin deacetylase (PgdA/CDA1 family)